MNAGLNAHDVARVGQTVGKYRLERLIGSGGMAAVYAAVHRNANRVAIKILHPQLSVEPEIRARFLREGYVANTVGHRGAVRVLDDDTTPDGSVFLVMELLEGETVDAWWEKRGRKSAPREAAEIGYQLLDVLAAAHAKGIVHRDIKPENLFLTGDGMLKVLDFGIARLRESTASLSQTRTGRMIGTPAFMPPEQALGRSGDIDGRTDLWAAGATLFTLMSGQFVHDAETTEAMLVYAGSRPARSLARVAPEVPPSLVRVVDRALIFNRAERWSSAREMEAALAGAYKQAFGSTIPGARETSTEADPVAFAETVRPEDEQSVAAEAVAPGLASAPSGDTAPMPPGAAAAAPAVSAPSGGRAVSTTAGVVSNRIVAQTQDDSVNLPMHRPIRKVAGLVAIALGIAVLSIGVGVMVLGKDRQAATGLASSAESVTAEGASPGPLTPSAAPSSVAASAAPAADAGPRSGAAAPSAVAVTPPAPKVTAKGSPRLPPVTSVQATPPPPPSPPRRNCDPPYTIDGQGHRIPKVECL
jgi:hypothetical protein